MVMDPDGPRCGCGRRGCFETLVSARAVIRLAREAMRRGHGPLTTLARAAGGRLTSQLVGRAARAGDARARRVWKTIGRRLGCGLANVVNLLNPDRIVIGGGVANNWALFAPALRATLRTETMAVSARAVRVVRGRLGDQAGVLGAAVLVWNETG
jgi:glucokinase